MDKPPISSSATSATNAILTKATRRTVLGITMILPMPRTLLFLFLFLFLFIILLLPLLPIIGIGIGIVRTATASYLLPNEFLEAFPVRLSIAVMNKVLE